MMSQITQRLVILQQQMYFYSANSLEAGLLLGAHIIEQLKLLTCRTYMYVPCVKLTQHAMPSSPHQPVLADTLYRQVLYGCSCAPSSTYDLTPEGAMVCSTILVELLPHLSTVQPKITPLGVEGGLQVSNTDVEVVDTAVGGANPSGADEKWKHINYRTTNISHVAYRYDKLIVGSEISKEGI